MSPSANREIPAGAIRVALPNVAQTEAHTCGVAAIAAIRAYYGMPALDEAALAAAMGIDAEGTDPMHVVRVLGPLHHRMYREMTRAELTAALDAAHPVMMTLQAWGEGHWLVAIGYDDDVLYVEDPAIYCGRGFITWAELDARWHDVEGPRVGIEIWGESAARETATHVD